MIIYESHSLNHLTTYHVYDPNLTQKPQTLYYDSKKKEFSYNKTFYFRGGRVKARPVYLSHFQ